VKAGRSNVDNVAMIDDAFMTEFKDFSLQNVVDNMEGMDYGDDDVADDVLPQAAQDMGSGKGLDGDFYLDYLKEKGIFYKG